MVACDRYGIHYPLTTHCYSSLVKIMVSPTKTPQVTPDVAELTCMIVPWLQKKSSWDYKPINLIGLPGIECYFANVVHYY